MLALAPVPVDDATRRQFLAAVSALTTVAACGSAPTPPRPAPGPAAIGHRYGSTEVPVGPRRIVTVGFLEQDVLLALGLVPVATTEFFGGHAGAVQPWAAGRLGSAPPPEVLTAAAGLQVERIAALRPDLILAVYSGLTRDEYTTLSRIAPTVAQPAEFADFGVPWQELTRIVGSSVGRRADADQLVAGVEARFAAVRAAHPRFAGASAVAANYEPGTYYLFGPDDPRTRLLTDLGFVVAPAVAELTAGAFAAQLSPERTDVLDQDVVVWFVADAAVRDALRAEPGYGATKAAVQRREVFVLDEGAVGGAANFQTVLSLPLLLDAVAPALTAALDGDPGTSATI